MSAPDRRPASGLTVYVTADPDGGYVVSTDGRAPGCVSQGDTVEEAVSNFADAYRAWASVVDERVRDFKALTWIEEAVALLEGNEYAADVVEKWKGRRDEAQRHYAARWGDRHAS